MQRFQGGLVLKTHRLCVSLNSRLDSNKAEEEGRAPQDPPFRLAPGVFFFSLRCIYGPKIMPVDFRKKKKRKRRIGQVSETTAYALQTEGRERDVPGTRGASLFCCPDRRARIQGYRNLYHSTLGSRVTKKDGRVKDSRPSSGVRPLHPAL